VAASGFKECVVSLASSDKATMALLKQEIGQDGAFQSTYMKVTLLTLSEDCAGSAEALRQVSEKISENSNIVVMPGDLVVTEASVLTQLVNAHRQSNLPPNNISTACTMLLAHVGEQDENGIPLKESSKVC
jgi:NDP-sugar pyrophosphorylase family protein